MARPIPYVRTLVSEDGVPIDSVHLAGDDGLAIIVAHGFTLSWQRPAVWRISTRLNKTYGVISFDFRGHGRSGGLSTLGDREIYDLDVAIRYARELGYQRVATVGFSMGASIVLRHAALIGGADAVVSVSGPGHWYFRGTERMRRVHWAVEHRSGRLITRNVLKTRINPVRWDPAPMPPAEAAALIAPTPLLIVHGDEDLYFPVGHAEELYEAAGEPKELWVLPGFGHAESAASGEVVDRIGRWVTQAVYPAGAITATPSGNGAGTAAPAAPGAVG
ncbi:MAG TPA: alpha/beta fold hydrolase [Streptosporangiaceae bacterium]